MTYEYDNRGKIFTDVISKDPVDVLVQTTKHLIRGTIYVQKDERLRDELDNERNVIALTDVSVLDAEGKTQYQSDFIALERKQIVWVIPVEDMPVEDKERLS